MASLSPDGLSGGMALLFGTLIVVAFSWERFNRISFEPDGRFERLVKLLTPDKLRARRRVGYSLFLYSISLVILYLILCAYAEVLAPIIGFQELTKTAGATGIPAQQMVPVEINEATTGFDPVDGNVYEVWAQSVATLRTGRHGSGNWDINIAPEVSLGLALILVGLAPAVPFLTRFDDWLRGACHGLAGIPTWAVNAADALRANAITLKIFPGPGEALDMGKGDAGYQVPSTDYERMRDLRKQSGDVAEFGNEFWTDLELILVTSAWFLDKNLNLPRTWQNVRLDELESALSERKAALLKELKGPLEPEDWELLAKKTADLATDMCILVALYVEHDLVLAGTADNPYRAANRSSNRVVGTIQSQANAQDKLAKLASGLKNETSPGIMLRRTSNIALFWTIGVVMIWTLIWVVTAGKPEFHLQRNYDSSTVYFRAVVYLFFAFSTYGIAIITAVTFRWLRHGTSQAHYATQWENLRYPKHWTKWLPQMLLVLFLSWLMSTVLVMAYLIWQSELRVEQARELRAILEYAWRVFEYNAPLALRGAVLASLVLILLDARKDLLDGKHGGIGSVRKRDSWTWAFIGGTVMLAVAVVTRYMTYRAGAIIAVGPVQRRPFDEIDAGLLIWAAIYSACLGALVLFAVSEALTGPALGLETDKKTDGKPEKPVSDATTAGA